MDSGQGRGRKKIIVIGDRVLIEMDKPEDRTEVGLYLPQTVVEKAKVAGGWVVSTGPGTAVPDPGQDEEEFWKESRTSHGRYIPLQCRQGDYALFLKKSSVEIKFDGKEYLIVPQGAILVLIRDHETVKSDDLDSLLS